MQYVKSTKDIIVNKNSLCIFSPQPSITKSAFPSDLLTRTAVHDLTVNPKSLMVIRSDESCLVHEMRLILFFNNETDSIIKYDNVCAVVNKLEDRT